MSAIKGLVTLDEQEGSGFGPCFDLEMYAVPRVG